ncbi:hypothetical protein [Salibacter halophilus]|uniref:STAS/SEC14 domain-containing protein n=1 Tax=Salibacter halophilus TaxID=1803916 RepID=A0A6N6M6L7_9FLAO|nr:hypothetical protein [Salibacter halophilus]KAB1065554.1 hypothetical protein F3059_02565 [Salibacter halophilus]
MRAIKEYDMDFGVVEIFSHFLVNTPKPMVHIGKKEIEKLFEIAQQHFANKPFGFIAVRKHSISFDPTNYVQTQKRFPNLKSIAVVSTRALTINFFDIEKKLINNAQAKLFNKKEDAFEWTLDVIKR